MMFFVDSGGNEIGGRNVLNGAVVFQAFGIRLKERSIMLVVILLSLIIILVTCYCRQL